MDKELKNNNKNISEMIDKNFKTIATDLAKELLITNKHLPQLLAMKCANDYMKEHGGNTNVPDQDVSLYSQKVIDSFIDHFVDFFA